MKSTRKRFHERGHLRCVDLLALLEPLLIVRVDDEAVKVAPVIAPTVALVRRPPGPGKGWGKGSR